MNLVRRKDEPVYVEDGQCGDGIFYPCAFGVRCENGILNPEESSDVGGKCLRQKQLLYMSKSVGVALTLWDITAILRMLGWGED